MRPYLWPSASSPSSAQKAQFAEKARRIPFGGNLPIASVLECALNNQARLHGERPIHDLLAPGHIGRALFHFKAAVAWGEMRQSYELRQRPMATALPAAEQQLVGVHPSRFPIGATSNEQVDRARQNFVGAVRSNDPERRIIAHRVRIRSKAGGVVVISEMRPRTSEIRSPRTRPGA